MMRVAAGDPDVHARMLRVSHLMNPPFVFREPGVTRRIRMEMAQALAMTWHTPRVFDLDA
jgi:hypothetical protein